MICKLSFIFTVIHWASAAVFVKGPCPEVQLADFNITAFCVGQWYEIARYPNDIETKGDCPTLNPYIDDGHCKFSTTEINDGKIYVIPGYVTNDAAKTGLVYLHSPSLRDEEIDHKFAVNVLVADYENFVFAYNCQYNQTTNIHHDYAWLWTRSRKFEGTIKKEFDELIKTHPYINSSLLIWEHFSEDYCKLKE